MKTVEEIRLEKLKGLVQAAGSIASLNRMAGRNERDATISQILNRWTGKTGKPKELGSTMARELESATGKPRGWMDNDPELQQEAWPFPSVSPQRFFALPERWQGRAEERLLAVIEEWEANQKSSPSNQSLGTHG